MSFRPRLRTNGLNKTERKFFAYVHPGAPGGISLKRPRPRLRKQDKRALPVDMYAVVFFPKITTMGRASVSFYGVNGTLATSPQTAIAKFMDSTAKGQKWRTYQNAGHRVRKIRVVDMGDA